MKRIKYALPVMAAAVFALGNPASAENPASIITETGQRLSVELMVASDALNNGSVLLDGTPVYASAWAAIERFPFPVNFVYVVDISGSTENPDFNPFQDINPPLGIGPEDDCNGDGVKGSALDAECFGLIALNWSLGDAATVDVALVAFAGLAKTADVGPAAGSQTFTSPPIADNGGAWLVPDMHEVIRSLDTELAYPHAEGIGLFTPDFTDFTATLTNYDAALLWMNQAFALQPAGETNIAYFLSDGNPDEDFFTTGPGSLLDDTANAGTVVNTLAVGTVAPGACGSGKPLRIIADTTGGTCTEVEDPSNLKNILPWTNPNITAIRLRVNTEDVDFVSGNEPVSMHLEDVDITAWLQPGDNKVEAYAYGYNYEHVIADMVLIGNVAPEIVTLEVVEVPAAVEDMVTAIGTFCDPGSGQTHIAQIDWGDDVGVSLGEIVSLGPTAECDDLQEVRAMYHYGSAGIHTVTMMVTDNFDASDSADTFAVIYDPTGGFVTGGGWIDSPEGAYEPDPALAGRANFGFVSKYKKGADVPTGNTEFQFKAADLNFKSTSYEWLVIAGSKAKFKGEGTINGAGNYRFMLTAVDGDLGGGDDTFRLKIWTEDEVTGAVAVIYDNGSDQALGSGSVVIHKAK